MGNIQSEKKFKYVKVNPRMHEPLITREKGFIHVSMGKAWGYQCFSTQKNVQISKAHICLKLKRKY